MLSVSLPGQRDITDPDEIRGYVECKFFDSRESDDARARFLHSTDSVEGGFNAFRSLIEAGRKDSKEERADIPDDRLLVNLPGEPHSYGCNVNNVTDIREFTRRMNQGNYAFPLATQLTTQTKEEIIEWLNKVMMLQEWDLSLFSLVAGLSNFYATAKSPNEADKFHCHRVATDIRGLVSYFRMEDISFLPEPNQSLVRHYLELFEKTYREMIVALNTKNTAQTENLMTISYKMYACLARVISNLLNGMLGKNHFNS